MTDYRVIVPAEHYQIIEFRQEDLPGIGVINKALFDFKPKVVFAWQLSLLIEFDGLADKGMPFAEKRKVVDQFGDSLDGIGATVPPSPKALWRTGS